MTPKTQSEIDRAAATKAFAESPTVDPQGFFGNSLERSIALQNAPRNATAMTNPRAIATLAAPVQGAKAGDPLNRSLDLPAVKDQPSKAAPEPADLPAWQQPLLLTKSGMNSTELVSTAHGMRAATTEFGNGKIGNSAEDFGENETARANARRINEWQKPLASNKGQ